MRVVTLLMLVFLLSACGPKNNYLNPDIAKPGFERVEVVLDYVHFVDGINELMAYDVDKNQRHINQLKERIEPILVAKSYGVKWALVASGVGLHPDMAFALHQDSGPEMAVSHPPFFIDSRYPYEVQNQLLASFMDAQRIALTPASKNNMRYLRRVRLDTIDLSSPETKTKAETSVAILHIRVLAPRVSFLKALGSSVVSVGVSSGGVGGSHVGIGLPLSSGNKSLTTALLYDNTSGQVLWKNQRSGDLSRLSIDAIAHFFKGLPAKL